MVPHCLGWMARVEGAGDEVVSRVPTTSVSLLATLADDPRSARWNELYSRYEPLMRSFLRSRFPLLDEDDLVQETMLALSRILPDYRYSPETKGSFHNYLTSILNHKALDAARRGRREGEVRADYRKERQAAAPADDDAATLKSDALELAIAQLLSDESVNPMHRTVFRRVALERENPESVATSLGISRANVDQIKKRLLSRLSALVTALLGDV